MNQPRASGFASLVFFSLLHTNLIRFTLYVLSLVFIGEERSEQRERNELNQEYDRRKNREREAVRRGVVTNGQVPPTLSPSHSVGSF